MHHGLQQADLLEDPLLAAQLIAPVVQPRLTLTQQARQGDGGAHVGQRVVGLAVVDTVGGGQALQLEGHPPLGLRPLDPLRTQGVGGAQQVDQVPAAVAALPLAGIGIEEVAVQAVAGDLVVEAQAVVAGRAGAGADQFGVQTGHELGFTESLARQSSGVDAGDQAGHRVRQDVVAGLAIQVERLADLVERLVGTNAGHLQRPVATRVDAGGFVVVPEDACGHGKGSRIKAAAVYPESPGRRPARNNADSCRIGPGPASIHSFPQCSPRPCHPPRPPPRCWIPACGWKPRRGSICC
ncbi:hypothetical protein D9M71_450830 [compost metagenome]